MDDLDLSAEQTLGKLLLLVNNFKKVMEDLIFRVGRFIFYFFLVTKKTKVIYIL